LRTRLSACAGWAQLEGVPPEDHVEFWVIDRKDAINDLGGQLLDAALTVHDLRREGKTMLHCVHAHMRHPHGRGRLRSLKSPCSRPIKALDRVTAVLPSALPRRSFVRALDSVELPA